jgi:hypothetical protein
MKQLSTFLKKNMRTTLIVSALGVTLLATVVSGREKADADLVVEPSVRTASQLASQGASPVSADDLDLDRLRRGRQGAPIADLFGADAPQQQAALSSNAGAGLAPDAAPGEAALPFQYLGRVIDEGKLSVFLARDNEPYSVREGQTIEHYRVDKVGEAAIDFTYLPSGTRKVLAIPPLN